MIPRIQNDERMRKLKSKAIEADSMVRDSFAGTLPTLSGPMMKNLTQAIADIQNKINLPQEARINVDTTSGVPSAEVARALVFIDSMAQEFGVDLGVGSAQNEPEMALVIAKLQDLSSNEGFISYMKEEEPESESETLPMEEVEEESPEPDMEAMFRARA